MTGLPGWCRLAAAAAAASVFPIGAKAVAAEPAESLRYPYVAALSRMSDGGRVYFCAGALVAPRWILTAAHCFHSRSGERIPPRDLWAVVGRDRLGTAGEAAQIRVAEVLLHPDYDGRRQRGDLALVRLAEIAGPLVAEAGAPARDPPGATMLGFGSFYEGRLAGRAVSATGAPIAQRSDRLRRAQVRLVDAEYCALRLGDSEAGAGRLCATAAGDDVCTGDSGGPLVIEVADGADRLLGIVSLGSGCAEPDPVVAYTRVAAYADWIASLVGPD